MKALAPLRQVFGPRAAKRAAVIASGVYPLAYRPNPPSPWPWVAGAVLATGLIAGGLWWLHQQRRPKRPYGEPGPTSWPSWSDYGTVVDAGELRQPVGTGPQAVTAVVRWRVVDMGVGSDGQTGGFEAQVMGRSGYPERKSGFYGAPEAKTYAIHQAALVLSSDAAQLSAMLAAAA